MYNLGRVTVVVSRSCLEGVFKVSLRCLEGVWNVSGRCLECLWKVSRRELEFDEVALWACLSSLFCGEIEAFFELYAN